MNDKPQYCLGLYDLDLNLVREYEDVIADGFVPNTTIRWIALHDNTRFEFSMDNYVLEFNKERQAIIDSQPKPS